MATNQKFVEPFEIHCTNAYTGSIDPDIAKQLDDNNVKNIVISNYDECKDIKVLDILSETGLTAMPKSLFNHFKALTHVRLIRTGITNLVPTDFEVASNLEEINLSRNRLTIIPANAFYYASKLTYINLASNKISDLHEHSFRGLSTLKYLSLSRNRIKTIQSGQFDGAPNIEELHIDNNQIETVEPFKLTQLLIISLRGNNIKTLPSDTFASTPLIEKIDLSSNDLLLPVDLFRACKHLYSLELDDNKRLRLNLADVGAIMNASPLTWLSMENTAFQLSGTKDSSRKLELLRLNLRNNQLSNASVFGIVAIFFPNLQEIDLSHNRFSSINNFENVRQLFPSLRRIGFVGNHLTAELLQSMEATSKNMDIELSLVDDDYM